MAFFGHFAGVMAQIGLQAKVVDESSNKKKSTSELCFFSPKFFFGPICKVDLSLKLLKVKYNGIFAQNT